MMWIVFGTGAIISALLNIVQIFQGKEAKYFRFVSLSLSALTLCAFFTEAATMAEKGDISALMDVMPTLSKLLWFLVILSILINSVSLFYKKISGSITRD